MSVCISVDGEGGILYQIYREKQDVNLLAQSDLPLVPWPEVVVHIFFFCYDFSVAKF